MKYLYLSDVGDGLCMRLDTIGNRSILIDCGSQAGSEKAFKGFEKIFRYHYGKPDIFILSHFHIDHYNGIFNMKNKSIDLKELYCPGIPEFTKKGLKEEYLMALLCMTARVLGNGSKSAEVDLINKMRDITYSKFFFRHLYQNDNVNINGLRIDVLWPPKILQDEEITKSIEKAVTDFNKALENDADLRNIYKKYDDNKIIEKYLYTDENHRDKVFYEPEIKKQEFKKNIESEYIEKDKDVDNGKKIETDNKEKLHCTIQTANESLRKAANHLSLSFAIDDRILFLGDLEKKEIINVIKTLKDEERKNFAVLITPHHGTHWDDSLKSIRCEYALSSNGIKMIGKFKEEFKKISNNCESTFVSGDILFPFMPFLSRYDCTFYEFMKRFFY